MREMTGMVVGIIFGWFLFHHTQYIAQNDATKKCKDAGGELQIYYDSSFPDSQKLIFSCVKAQEFLFKTN